MMKDIFPAEKIDVVVLCGGLGKRLQPVLDGHPKVMAEINQQPFMDILIAYVGAFGFKRFILCTGYKGDEIRRYYEKKKLPFEIIFSQEKEQLGTAGAIKNAERFIQSPHFLAFNGDSLCRIDLKDFFVFHVQKNALLSLVLADTKEKDDYGSVAVDAASKITGFSEKASACVEKRHCFVNAGAYIAQKEILALIPPGVNFSLERDLFPSIVGRECYGYVTHEPFLDIGTPERYAAAKKILTKHNVRQKALS